MKAEIIINRSYTVGSVDKRIYGSFIEHLGRAVYTGIYEPGHPTADENGFRRDVIELVKKLNVPIVRYPGGNFVSGYNWEDGTGDKAKRPAKRDLAWNSIETNEVGIDEFQGWVKLVGAEVMMAVNMGTRGIDDARNLIEYCNADTDTYYANKRRENGFEEPFGIKVWCLGNEMDGQPDDFWQMGAKEADDYSKLACETAKIMRWSDRDIQITVCGSTHENMKTFGEWDLTVLERTYNHIDYISVHRYFDNMASDTPDFLAQSLDLDYLIKSVTAMCDTVKAKKHSKKTVNLSLDEWNIWYHSIGKDRDIPAWSYAPPRLEDIYNFEDALVLGCVLCTIQNNADRVKIACLAQLVNVIAPIMTEKGGRAWAQTIFYPFMYASNHGRGTTMRTVINCDTYSTDKHSDIPYLESSVILGDDGTLTVFAINRSLDEDIELSLNVQDFGEWKILSHTELYCDDLKAVNTADSTPIMPREVELPDSNVVTLKKHSWNMLKLKY